MDNNIKETNPSEEQNKKKNNRIRSARSGSTASLVATISLAVITAIVVTVTVGILLVEVAFGFDISFSSIGGLMDFGTEAAEYKEETAPNVIKREDGTVSARQKNVYNFLVVGQDRKANLTDVMMLIKFDASNDKITLMQMPRDSMVCHTAYACLSCQKPSTNKEIDKNKCSKCGDALTMICKDNIKKLNSVYGTYYSSLSGTYTEKVNFGMKGLSLTLSQALNINIDYYAHMDLEGFREIVDTLGGVYMNVPRDMYYNDPEQNLYINLKAGPQLLDGEKAEQFVRFRSGYRTADHARQDAQKLFMVAFFKTFKEEIGITNVFSILSTMMEYVTHSIPTDELDYFGREALGMDFENITMLSAPNLDANVYGASYVVIQRQPLFDIINQHFNLYEDKMTEEQFDSEKIFTIENYYEVNSKYESTETYTDQYTAEDIEGDSIVLK